MKWILGCALLLTGLLTTACRHEEEDHVIWDFLNYSVAFSVTDAATGADLLDPRAAGNLVNDPIRVRYGEQEFGLQSIPTNDFYTAATRSNAPRPLGLRLTRLLRGYEGPYPIPGPWILTFGEFSPEQGWRGESFTIEWGDGIVNEVTFDCYVVWESPQEPKVVRHIWFDGVEQESWLLELTR